MGARNRPSCLVRWPTEREEIVERLRATRPRLPVVKIEGEEGIVIDDEIAAESASLTDEALWEYVAEIVFETHDGPDADCLLCKAWRIALPGLEHFCGTTLADCVADLDELNDQ